MKRATALTLVITAAFLHGVTAASAEAGAGPRQRWDCVAFAADGDIYVVNLDGTGLTRLTADAADFSPKFSPDGTKIAYVNVDKDGIRWAVYIMNADGSDKRRLSPAKEVMAKITNLGDGGPVFSPDGERVAATRSINGGGEIIFFPTSGGAEELFSKIIEDAWKRERRPIPTGTPLWADISGPAFSADGRKIAYRVTPNCSGSWLCIANADGSGARRLTEDGRDRTFSPDGKKLAFYAWAVEGRVICVINADGTGRRQLTNGDRDEGPAFSPDGKKIIYESGVSRRSGAGSDIFIMNADGSERQALTRTPTSEYGARFTPDGSKIVFAAYPLLDDDSAEPGIYVMNADGSGRRFLVDGGGFSLGPSLVGGRLVDSYGNWHDVVDDLEATPPGE